MQHHAYFYEGPLSLFDELAEHARSLFKFERGSPDLLAQTFEKFGIEDAQKLKDQAAFKSTSGRALFVVGIGSITSEAQQALLKLFEEPQAGSTFVLLLPHGVLLPTLRSRLMKYQETLLPTAQKVLGSSLRTQPDFVARQAAEFLKASYKTRSASITALLKEDEGAKERVRELLSGLEVELYSQLQKSKDKKEWVSALEDIAQVRSYVADRSPSLKMLLEHLAATLPTL